MLCCVVLCCAVLKCGARFSTGRIIYTGNSLSLGVIVLNAKLLVDNKEIGLNEFVEKFLSGMLAGAVTSLRGVKEDWKKIEITVEK